MNILPKKRWHVRTKANIDRVRRDEANALEEAKEAERRALLAQQEARTSLLREKAGLREGQSGREIIKTELKSETLDNSSSHVNFFQDLEEGKNTYSGGNKEYLEEKKKEQEKLEKNIGLLTYLGQSATESKNERPWEDASKRPVRLHETERIKEEVSLKTKAFLDPMKVMGQYLGEKQATDKPQRKIMFVKSGQEIAEKIKSEKRHKHKKHHKKKRKKHSLKKSDTESSSSSECESSSIARDSKRNVVSCGSKTIVELRQERLQRELVERKKTELLLAKLRGDPIPPEPTKQTFTQKFNSQFNPHLARQNN